MKHFPNHTGTRCLRYKQHLQGLLSLCCGFSPALLGPAVPMPTPTPTLLSGCLPPMG